MLTGDNFKYGELWWNWNSMFFFLQIIWTFAQNFVSFGKKLKHILKDMRKESFSCLHLAWHFEWTYKKCWLFKKNFWGFQLESLCKQRHWRVVTIALFIHFSRFSLFQNRRLPAKFSIFSLYKTDSSKLIVFKMINFNWCIQNSLRSMWTSYVRNKNILRTPLQFLKGYEIYCILSSQGQMNNHKSEEAKKS